MREETIDEAISLHCGGPSRVSYVPLWRQTDNASAAGEPQPSDLHYEIAIKDGRTLFHLGEAIEIEEIHSDDVTMKYLLLGLPQQVMGHPLAGNDQARKWRH